jgi:tetratricopeptide (TPR) repeat protein
MKSGSRLFVLLFCGWLGTGCALQTPPKEAPASPAEPKATAIVEPQPELPPRPFPTETLYSLLAAEMAGSRQQYDIALSNYAQQAQETRDPQVAERATMIARYLNDNATAAANAVLWAELEPDNDQALGNASYTLMQEGRLLEAFEMSRRLRQYKDESLFQSIAANAGRLTYVQREELLAGYLQELEKYPQDEQLLIGLGLLSQLQERPEDALEYARQTLKVHPRSTAATLLESSVLHHLNRTDEAIARLAAMLEHHPHHLRLRLQYARLLVNQDLSKAHQQFEILVQQHPEDPDLLLSLALVAMEEKNLDSAANALEQLLDFEAKASIANFYLGQVSELRGERKRAVLHYLQVQPGENFLQANVNLLNIMVSEGDLLSASQHIERVVTASPELADNYQLLHAQALTRHDYLEAADAVLTQALTRSPNNADLRYSRALVYEKQNQLPKAEQDLRLILTREPNNPLVLNALGYMLADRTQRLAEAQEFLLQAVALSPEDPAIIDSLGWLYFRLGDYSEALVLLRRAYHLYPDPEVAAHLGEVLWVIGEQDEARNVWQQSLERHPGNLFIESTMERLQVAP